MGVGGVDRDKGEVGLPRGWQSVMEPGALPPSTPETPADHDRAGVQAAEEEEVHKIMERKMQKEQERRKRKEMGDRLSLEETREQILKLLEKLQALQEEKHQLILQLEMFYMRKESRGKRDRVT